jgi:hypothetical protein
VIEQNSTNKKVLVIGCHLFEGVESFDWFQDLPNISDYDIVILDTPRIFTFLSLAGRLEHLGENEYSLPKIDETVRKVKSNISLVRQKLVEILEFDVTVYALYAPNIRIGTKVDRSLFASPDIPRGPTITGPTDSKLRKWVLNPHDTFDTNDWCPISIKSVAEKGKITLIKDKTYEEYFKDFKSWQYYFDLDYLDIRYFEQGFQSKWKVTSKLNVIATNKVDKPIAIEFVPQFHKWESPDHRAWRSATAKTGGSLVLLPVIDIYHTEFLIEVLLKRIKGVEKTPPPGWVSSIEIPGEAPLRSEIATEERKLQAIESKIGGLRASLRELQGYKGLLYETGLPLQELVKSTLEKFGASTEPSPVSDEFIISAGGRKALIEVKGISKGISKDDLGQLVVDKGEYIKLTGQDIKGILIGNAWRLLRLEQRDTKGTAIFPRNILQIAQNQDIGLISTTELFRAFCKTLEEPEYKKEVLNKIITGKGVITF